MKVLKLGIALAAAIFLSGGNTGYAVDAVDLQTLGDLGEAFGARDVRISFSPRDSKLILAADSDRGCCFWKTAKGSCTYTSEGFCRVKAKEVNVRFEFYLNKSCRELAVCK